MRGNTIFCDPSTQFRRPMMSTRISVALFAILLLATLWQGAASADGRPVRAPLEVKQNTPKMIRSDGLIRLSFGEERIVLPRGLQPSLLCTQSGTLILQAQIPE